MKLLVLSDSHGDRFSLFEAIEREKGADLVYLLGDGAREMQDAAEVYGGEMLFVLLRGNCDYLYDLPAFDIRCVGNRRIFATHGYAEQVKYGLQDLKFSARSEKCSLALFGHTHQPFYSYEDGLYLFNPGSIRNGDYGVIQLSEKGVLCNNMHLI